MKKIINTFIITTALFFVFALSPSGAQSKPVTRGSNPEKTLFGKKRNEIKVREPRKVIKAKREQEKKEQKRKKEYAKFVKANRKRSYQIQSPEVKERMKKNQKEIIVREKAKKKNERKSTSRARKKY